MKKERVKRVMEKMKNINLVENREIMYGRKGRNELIDSVEE